MGVITIELSRNIIKKYVEVATPVKITSNDKTVYGTISGEGDELYVKLDGSDVLTPISSTIDVRDGDRVLVLIKNHEAMVLGSPTSPTARLEELRGMGDQITEFGVIIADKVGVGELVAMQALIDELEAKDVEITGKLEANEAEIDTLTAENATINGKLTAYQADIEELRAKKIDATEVEAKYATIDNLDAANATIDNLDAAFANFETVTVNKLTVQEGYIDELRADMAEIDTLYAKTADIETLYAKKADVESLEANVADIDTLIFGSASGTTIQASFANAVIAQLGNAQIKSAMIENISADKINAGDINTNSVRVVSKDGRLVISDETIQISDETRVRVQIGKDGAGDYSISVWDSDGNLMFSEGGITDSAIKEAIIRNDMVANDANISASKLDISSLFKEINGSTETINAGRVTIDTEGQTLDVAFTSMSTELDALNNSVTSQGTQLSVVQGQISSKIWQQDIESATDELSKELETLSTSQSSLEQTVDGIAAIVSSHETAISNKADSSEVTAVSDKVSQLEIDIDKIETSVRATETEFSDLEARVSNAETTITQHTEAIELRAKKTEVVEAIDALEIGGRNLLTAASSEGVVANATYSHRSLYLHDFDNLTPGETYTISFEGELPEDCESWYLNVYRYDENDNVTYPVFIDEFEKRNGRWIGTGVCPSGGRITLLNLYAVPLATTHSGSIVTSHVKLERGNKATDWTLAPEDTASASDLLNYYTIEQTKAALNVKADEISSSVSKTYATKQEVKDIEIGGRNLLADSDVEKTNEAGTSQAEFVKYADLAPIFDEYGLIEYTLSFDIKSVDVTNANSVYVYCNNGNGTRHQIGYYNVPITTEYVRHSLTFTPSIQSETETESWLTFYGTYNTGNIPSIKNVKIEKGNKATDWTPALEDVDEKIDSGDTAIRETMTEQISSVVQDTENIILTALESYTQTSTLESLRETIKAELAVMSDKITMNFETSTQQIADVDRDLQEWIAKYSKHITFDENGIVISSGNSSVTIQLDNEEGVVIRRNGEIQSQLTEDNFYTGNIVVEVDERAQFGKLAAIPRTKGSLMWVKVGE